MSRRQAALLTIFTALAVALLDQASKAWAQASLPQGREVTVISGWLWFRITSNSGATLGILTGQNTLLLVVTLVIVVAIAVITLRGVTGGSRLALFALGLVAGGSLGNLVDRVRLGAVIDFIEIHLWPTDFNVADAAIRAGVLLLIGALLLDARRGRRRGQRAQPDR
jgi:signal peptidase II